MIPVEFGALLTYPNINPILVEWGPFVIRWYALAYIAGLIFGWYYVVHLANRPDYRAKGGLAKITRQDIDDFVMWATLGIILGGRLGYVLFYNAPLYFKHPSEILRVWEGGMSFHGGLLGTVVAMILFTKRRKIPLLVFTDLIACAVPIGLFLGRIANFINGELYGHVSNAPWAMIFPGGGPLPRHPSQLYEAGLEGLVLFILLWVLFHKTGIRQKSGVLTGIFLTGYGLARMFVELFRQPDSQLGYLFDHITMGQVLSLPMVLAGIYLIAQRHWHDRA